MYRNRLDVRTCHYRGAWMAILIPIILITDRVPLNIFLEKKNPGYKHIQYLVCSSNVLIILLHESLKFHVDEYRFHNSILQKVL